MEFTMAQENNKSSSLKRIDKLYLEQVIAQILEVRIRMINLERPKDVRKPACEAFAYKQIIQKR